jgi:hypothetical protein
MPELGTMPYLRDKGRRVVRLVSSTAETDLTIELQTGVNKIGRQRNGNHIVLVSGEVSRFHAEVVVADDSLLVRDLESANGTFVNGRRVKDSRVNGGDQIAFSSQFSFFVQVDMVMQSPEVVTLPPEAGSVPAPQVVPPPAERRPSPPEPDVGFRRITARGMGASAPLEGALPPGAAAREPSPPAGPQVAEAPAAAPCPIPTPIRPLARGPARGGPQAPAASAHQPGPVPEDSFVPPPLPPSAALDPEIRRQSLASAVEETGRDGPSEPPELALLEKERRQLAVLYQVSKRCMAAETLAELDRLLINVLERIVPFDRGFITYQLPSGDWKLVMSPKGDRWDRTVVRTLLQTALKTKGPLVVPNSTADDRLGSPVSGRKDSRLLLPLRSRSAAVGAVFLVSSRTDSFDDQTVDFLSLFADIAALAVVNCGRLEARS